MCWPEFSATASLGRRHSRFTRDMNVGADGNVWFTEKRGSQIGRITPSGWIAEWPTLTPGAVPMSIGLGLDGNVWFSEDIGKIGRITATRTITEFPTPTPSGVPSGVRPGPAA